MRAGHYSLDDWAQQNPPALKLPVGTSWFIVIPLPTEIDWIKCYYQPLFSPYEVNNKLDVYGLKNVFEAKYIDDK